MGEQKCESAAAEMEEQGKAVAPESITLEQANHMLKQADQLEFSRQKDALLKVKSESLTIVKAEYRTQGQVRKHVAIMKKVCKQIPESKSLLAGFPPALLKKDADKTDADKKTISQLEKFIDERLQSLDFLMEEETKAKAAKRREQELVVNEVKQIVEFEAEEREGKEWEASSAKEALKELKSGAFEKLKTGAWETPKPPAKLLNGLKEIFKQLEIDEGTKTSLTRMLKMKPSERGNFDGLMVTQLEQMIDKRLGQISGELATVDPVVKYTPVREAIEAMDAAQDSLDSARALQVTHFKAAVTSAQQAERLLAKVEEQKRDVEKKIEETKEYESSCAAAQSDYDLVLRARDGLASLRGKLEEDGTVIDAD